MATFEISKGINFNGWMRVYADNGKVAGGLRGKEHLEFIRDEGYDHVRLPADEKALWDDDGSKIEERWALIDPVLDLCEECGLKVIFDLHSLRTHHFWNDDNALYTDPEAPKRWAALWMELADVLGKRDNSQLAYELMNEPVANDHEDWNRVLTVPYRAVRDREPERTMIIGGNRWCNVYAIKHLRVPENDPNIIVTFHFYDPMPLTHYKASFTEPGRVYDGPVQYPGLPIPPEEYEKLDAHAHEVLDRDQRHYDYQVQKEAISQVLTIRERYGLPLYCSEFGMSDEVPEDIRLAWARDIRKIFDELDVSWAPWLYRGSLFAMYDENNCRTAVCRGLVGE